MPKSKYWEPPSVELSEPTHCVKLSVEKVIHDHGWIHHRIIYSDQAMKLILTKLLNVYIFFVAVFPQCCFTVYDHKTSACLTHFHVWSKHAGNCVECAHTLWKLFVCQCDSNGMWHVQHVQQQQNMAIYYCINNIWRNLLPNMNAKIILKCK